MICLLRLLSSGAAQSLWGSKPHSERGRHSCGASTAAADALELHIFQTMTKMQEWSSF